MEEYLRIRKGIDIPVGLVKISEITKYLEDILSSIELSEDGKKMMRWDIELLSCWAKRMMVNDSDRRLNHYYESPDGYLFPDVKNFEKEREYLYEKLMESENNIFLKVRYLEYLVESGVNKYIFVNSLLDSVLKILEQTDELSDFFDYVTNALLVAIKFYKREYALNLINLIYEELTGYLPNDYNYVRTTSEICFNIKDKTLLTDIQVESLKYYLETSSSYYFDNMLHHDYKNTTEELIRWYKLEKNDEKITELQESIREMMLKASFQENTPNKSSIVEAYHLEQSLQLQMNSGSNKDNHEKSRIKEIYRSLEDSDEMQVIETTLSISNKTTLDFLEKTQMTPFVNVMMSAVFIPPIKKVNDEVDTNVSKNWIMKYANYFKIHDGKKVISSTDEDSYKKIKFGETYTNFLTITFLLYFNPYWNKHYEDIYLEPDNIYSHISSWKFIDKNKLAIIEAGIKRLLAEDYVSALHILIPQFENLIRFYFEQKGYATTSIHKGITQEEKTFNVFIEQDFVVQNMDADFLMLIKMLLLDKYGYNLRNKLAHGLANTDEFTKQHTLYVIYLYFIMTKLS